MQKNTEVNPVSIRSLNKETRSPESVRGFKKEIRSRFAILTFAAFSIRALHCLVLAPRSGIVCTSRGAIPRRTTAFCLEKPRGVSIGKKRPQNMIKQKRVSPNY